MIKREKSLATHRNFTVTHIWVLSLCLGNSALDGLSETTAENITVWKVEVNLEPYTFTLQ